MVMRLVGTDSVTGQLPDVVLDNLDTRFPRIDPGTNLPASPAIMAALGQKFVPASEGLTFAGRLAPLTGGLQAAPVQLVALSTAGTFRVPYTVVMDGGNIRFDYSHHYQATAAPQGDTDPAAAITIEAAALLGGTIYRVTFGGRRSVTIDPGGKVRSDPVGLDVKAGDVLNVLTYLASGTAYGNRTNFNNPGGRYTNDVVGGGGFTAGSNLTAPGSAAIPDAESNLYGPTVLLGDTNSRTPVVVGIGDSIMAGQGDSNDMGGHINVNNAGGWFQRAFAGVNPNISLAKASEKGAQFVLPANHFRRAPYITPGCWALEAYGRNDILDGASVTMSGKAAIWQMVKRRGGRVATTTVTPETSSSDSWATAENQTVLSATREAARVEINTWLRAGAPLSPTTGEVVAPGTAGAVTIGNTGHPVAFLIDTADAVESSRNSGKWKFPGYTYDGLHPLAPGHVAMAAAVPTGRFSSV